MENKIIELLMQELAELRAENKELLEIIKNYSKQETKVINDIKVNSYNGSSAEANGGTHTQANYNNGEVTARNIGAIGGNGTVNDTKLQ